MLALLRRPKPPTPDRGALARADRLLEAYRKQDGALRLFVRR